MIFDNKQNMGSVLSIQKEEIKIICKDEELKEKTENVLEALKENVSSNNWSKKDYLTFLKHLYKLDTDTFNEAYSEIITLLNLPLEELEKRLRYLDTKLELQLFITERCTVPVVQISPLTGRQVTTQKVTFKPHEFEPTDIIYLFKKLNSKINSHNHIIIDTCKEKILKDKSFEEQELEIKMLLDLFISKDTEMHSMIEDKYLSWINSLPKEDSIYEYLLKKLPYIISQNERELRIKLINYKKKETDDYKCNQYTNFLNQKALYEKKSRNKDYWRNH